MCVSILLSLNIALAQNACKEAIIDSPNDAVLPWKLECGISDTFCPEKYGDWSACTRNAYNGPCTTPDPDCTDTYGYLNLNVPLFIKPSANLNLDASATGVVSGGNLKLTFADYTPAALTVSCISSPCTYTFIQTAPSTGGTKYTYALEFFNFGV